MSNAPTPAPHARSIDEVVEDLKTDSPVGLSSGEADARLKPNSSNRLREQKRKSVFAILVNQFESVIVWLLAFAAGLSFVFGEFAEGIAIVALFWLKLDTGTAVTAAFLTITLGYLWKAFHLCDPRPELFVNDASRNGFVWSAIILCLGLIATTLWLPGLSGLLKIELPAARGFLLAASASLMPVALGQIWLVCAHNDPSISAEQLGR